MRREKTAVEWLVDEFKEKLTGSDLPNWVLEIVTKAKAMEKEQMKQIMWHSTDVDMPKTNKGLIIDTMFNQYYNETYGDEK